MIKLYSHKNPILLGVGILAVLATILVFTTCDIGLGQIVNTEKPIISNGEDGNGPGSFLQGSSNTIELDVENKLGFKIKTVEMEVEYIDKNTGERTRKTFPGHINAETGKWEVDLDTTDMQDGKISAWVTAIDESGNETTSTEITYFVKNKLPQIEMTIPVIVTERFDNDVFLNDLKGSDPVYRRFSLMGVATDDFGIWTGFPKIMIWPAGYDNIDADGLPMLDPNGPYGYWYSMEDIPEGNTTATRFSWPMLNLKYDPTPSTADSTYPKGGKYRLPKKGTPGDNREDFLSLGNYRFRIWTKDRFGNDNFYPDRTDHEPDKSSSKKYIEISYKSATSTAMAKVTDCPQFYNTSVDFNVPVLLERGEGAEIDESNPVRAIISKVDESVATLVGITNNPNILWQGDAYKDDPDSNSIFKLNVSAATAQNWSLPADNRLYIKTWVVAANGLAMAGPELTTFFVVDKTRPELQIDRPILLTNKKGEGNFSDGGAYVILHPALDQKPKWVTGIITVGGVPKDPGTNPSGVKKILYHFGKLSDDQSLTDAARKTLYDSVEWKDTKLNTSNPLATDDIGGKWEGTQFSWTWTKTFENEFRDNNPLIVQSASDLGYSSAMSDWSSRRTDGDRVRFYLPFYVKVIDNIDNYRIIHYTLCVDPKMDEPQVTITQPEVKLNASGNPTKPIVGGTVRIAGFAEDNFWMHTVLIRVKKEGASNYYLPVTNFYDDPLHSSYPTPMKTVGITTTPDKDGWFETTKIGDSSNVNWYANINQDRLLDPLDSGTVQPVTIEVVAIDCDEEDLTHNRTHIVGPVEKLDVEFSKDVPMISNVKIKKSGVSDRDYSEGIKAAGTFSVTMDVEAMGDINNLAVRINNSQQAYTLVSNNLSQSPLSSSWTLTNTSFSGDKATRTLTIAVNSTASSMISYPTTTPISGYAYGSTGNLILEVTAVDDTVNNLSTTNIFTIGIDNLFPTADIQTPHIAFEDLVNLKYYSVTGTAKDYVSGSESVQGLERMLVYFEKATISRPNNNTRNVTGSGTFINPNGGANLNNNTAFTTYPNVLDFSSTNNDGKTPNVTSYTRYPTLNTLPSGVWKSDSAMVIDKQEVVGTSDKDEDGTYGEVWEGNASSYREWGARVKFTGWSDGPYIVHYLIMDQAGNASHYQNDIYVQNNKPKITSINFGTDINGSGSVTTGANSSGVADGSLNEYLFYSLDNNGTSIAANTSVNTSVVTSKAGEMSPSFRIRGNRFSVRLTYTGGNSILGNIKAKVAYATTGAEASASTMTRGNLYEIKSFGSSSTDFTKYGAPNNIEGTVFVATGPVSGTGIGTVIPYTVTGTPSTLNPASTSATVDFTTFNTGWDSPKDGSGNITSNNVRYFIVKVYDTTIASATNGADVELDQLSDALLVKLDIDNVDNKKPTLNILPFGQEYYVNPSAPSPLNNPAYDGAKTPKDLSDADYIKNIGTSTKTEDDGTIVTVKEGYVQYQKHNLDSGANSYISGKVKFIGKVEDNQRLGGIWVKISNYSGVGTTAANTLFQIARPITSGNSAGLLEPVPPDGTHTDHWAFKIIDSNYLTLDYGHALTWEFMWDSSKVADVARSDVTVTFEVRDAATTPNVGDNKQLTVNIVPYISEIVTSLSEAFSSTPSVFNRSALGGYPVREGETITIKGFNLGTTVTNGAANNVTIGGGTNYVNVTARTNTSITGSASASLSSGPLVVRVNSIDSFNNNTTVKNKTAAYNKEPNNVNNNILDNSRYIYVWRTGDLFSGGSYSVTMNNNTSETINMANVSYPFMRLDKNGNRLISHGFYSAAQRGRLRVLKNNTLIDLGTAATNRMVYTTVGTSGRNNSFYAAGTDLSSSADYNRGFQLGLSNPAGTNSIAGHQWVTGTTGTGTTNTTNANNTTESNNYANHGNILIYKTNDSANDRFSIPRIAVQNSNPDSDRTDGSRDNILLSYYDSFNNRIEVIYGTVGVTAFTPAYSTSTTYNYGIINTYSTSTPPVKVTDGGSMYTAAGLLSDGTPLVAWYNSGDQKLYFSYGTGSGTTNANWNTNKAVIDTNKGTYVDMAVDASNNVHLAYYNNSGGLWYTYIPAASVKNANRTVTPVRVDTYLSAGTRIMINVRGTTPYITYAHASFPGTKQSVRVAWLTSTASNTSHSTTGSNMFLGNWEVMTVPINNIPNNEDYICNGVPYNGSNITWASPNIPLSGLNYSNLEKTIVVGYMTSSSYEGAILKDNILTVPSILQK